MCQKLGVLPAEERAAELLAQFRTQRPTAARRSNWWLISYLPNNPYIVFRGAVSIRVEVLSLSNSSKRLYKLYTILYNSK